MDVVINSQAWQDVRRERDRQESLWGSQTHPTNGKNWVEWMSVLTEEVGELAQNCNDAYYRGDQSTAKNGKHILTEIYEEAIQSAAVAQAIAETALRRRDELLNR